jgi:hypothetical protein
MAEALLKAEQDYPAEGNSAVTKEEYTEIVYQMLLHISAASTTDRDRFVIDPHDLICGEFEHAAKGPKQLLNVPDDHHELFQRGRLDSVAVIEKEVRELGNRDVSEQLHYILRLPASLEQFPCGMRDQGHEGMVLQDFVEHKHSKTAKLEEAEVVALRLFTTSAFRHINNPLRDQARISSGEPHPLPVTVMLIIRGIRKLRVIGATGDEATRSMALWRGMRNVRPTDMFAKNGGTEVCVDTIIGVQTHTYIHTHTPIPTHTKCISMCIHAYIHTHHIHI